MEKIKKIIKQSLVLEKKDDHFIIKPNENTYYNIKFLLKNDNINMGLFDYYMLDNE